MTVTAKVFSLQGKGLKLDTRADIEPYLHGVDTTKIEEIHLGGNTLGVDAAEALAEFLKRTQVLKVCSATKIRYGMLTHLVPSIDCRFRRYLHWSPNHRNSARADCDMRCTEGQEITYRAQLERQCVWRSIGRSHCTVPDVQPQLPDIEAQQQWTWTCGWCCPG